MENEIPLTYEQALSPELIELNIIVRDGVAQDVYLRRDSKYSELEFEVNILDLDSDNEDLLEDLERQVVEMAQGQEGWEHIW